MSKGALAGGSKMSNVLKASEDLLKTPEQLEEEKQQILAHRIPKLDLDRKNKDDLVKAVDEFYQKLVFVTSYFYDLGERIQAQKYEMAELAERARQIEKGKNKKKSGQFTGLGGSVFTNINEFFPQAPPKISLFSPFERVNDRRTLAERHEVFNGAHVHVPYVSKTKVKIAGREPAKTKKSSRRKAAEEAAPAEAPAE